jgi:DNA-binding NtrC family response regulator
MAATVSLTKGSGRSSAPRAAEQDTAGAFRVLIIDEDCDKDPLALEFLSDALRDLPFRIDRASGMDRAVRVIEQQHPGLALLHSIHPDFDGLEKILDVDPGVDVMIVAGHGSADGAIDAIRRGAYDYMVTPISLMRLKQRLHQWADDGHQRNRTYQLDSELVRAFQLAGIVGRSPAMLEVFSKIRRIAPHFQTAIVAGETGTGKELVAKVLHQLSPRSSGPFVVCNCTAIPEHLFESELFGHVRGAFTGAVQDHVGFAKAAHGGTLFLDEIGELPLSLQPKLLRFLQNREIQRLGSPRPEQVDVRVVAATNQDPRVLVRERKLREDFYYRLCALQITLPRLEDRKEDLPMLQRHFLDLYGTRFAKGRVNLTRRAQAAMARYSWPGNIRELENVIAGCCMMAEGSVIDLPYLPEALRSAGRARETGSGILSMAQVHVLHAQQVLRELNGNRARAAAILGISRATLYRILANDGS